MAKKQIDNEDNVTQDASSFLYEEEQLDEEYREEVGSSDDDPNLDESLIVGDKKAKACVLKLYKDLNFVSGHYYPAYLSTPVKIFTRILLIVMLIVVYAFGIKRAIDGRLDVVFGIIMAFCTVFIIVFFILLREKKISVHWWRDKNRTISIYKTESGKNKGDIIVYVNREYMWRYDRKQDQWKINDTEVMGSRLFFDELVGRLKMTELKDGSVRISAYGAGSRRESANLVIKNDVPQYIEKIVVSKGPGEKSVMQQRFCFKEVNSGNSATLPVSFRTFCEENVIEPLEESERLYYV